MLLLRPLVAERYVFVTIPVIKNHKQFKNHVKYFLDFMITWRLECFMITWRLECLLTFPILDSSSQSLRRFDNTNCKVPKTSFGRICFTKSLQLIETGFENSQGTDIRHFDSSTPNLVACMDPQRTKRCGIS